MNGIAASTIASGARFGRTRIARPISTPGNELPAANGERRQPQRRRQDVVHRLHGLEQHDRTGRGENRRGGARHAAGELPARSRMPTSTRTNAAIGVSQKIASCPNDRGERRHQHRHARRADRRRGIGVDRRRDESARRERARRRPATARRRQRAVRLQTRRARMPSPSAHSRRNRIRRPPTCRARRRTRPAQCHCHGQGRSDQRLARRSLGEGGSF